MSSYTVKIDFQDGGGWVELTNYSGTNLVQYRSIKKTQTLHNNYHATVDKCVWKILNNSVIAGKILTASDYILVSILKDGSDYFTGVCRPTSDIKVSTNADFIDFEALDNSYKLDKKNSAVIEYYSDKVCDPADTGNSIIHKLLTLSGLVAGDIGTLPTISDALDAYEINKDSETYFDLIDDIFFPYGYVFYYSNDGKINAFQWRGTASTTSNITTANIISDIEISKDDIDFDSVKVSYPTIDTANISLYQSEQQTINASSTWESDDVLYPDSFEYVSGYPTSASNTFFKPSLNTINSSSIVHFDNITYNIFALQVDPILTGKYETGLALDTYMSAYDIKVSDANYEDTYLNLTVANDEANKFLVSVRVLADVYWKSEVNESIYPTGTDNNFIELSTDIPLSEAAGKLFSQGYYETKKYNSVKYTFGSTEDFDVGEYCNIVLAAGGIASADVRIIKKITTEEYPIIQYIAEGVGAISAITATEQTYTVPGIFVSEDVIAANNLVEANLNPVGVSSAIIGANLTTITGVSEAGLYLHPAQMGYHDGTDWTAYIHNDGDFLFKGDDDNYVEWDGSKLSVYGDLFLSGDSVIQGSVAVGTDLSVAGTISVGTGVEISGASAGVITVGVIELDGAGSGEININDEIILDGANKRYSIYDGATIKMALGYLGGILSYTTSQYGLYIADGNVVRFEGGGRTC